MFGFFRREKRLPEMDRSGHCPSCGCTAHFLATRAVNWLVLFFVPVPIPGAVVHRCARCGARIQA